MISKSPLAQIAWVISRIETLPSRGHERACGAIGVIRGIADAKAAGPCCLLLVGGLRIAAPSILVATYFAFAYGANWRTFSFTCSSRPIAGNARWAQSSRSQTLQPVPIGVAAAGSFRSSPVAYTSRCACRTSHPSATAKVRPGAPNPPRWRDMQRATHK